MSNSNPISSIEPEFKERHYHICEMHLRVKTCEVKIHSCENMKVNGECFAPITSGICENRECVLLAQLVDMQRQRDAAKGDHQKEKKINDYFRNLLLMPTDIKERFEKGTLDYSGIQSEVRKQHETYELIGVDTMMFLVAARQALLEDALLWVNEKRGKETLEFEVNKRKAKETEKALHIETERKKKEEKKEEKPKTSKPKLTKFQQHVAAYVKIGIPEADAIRMVTALGIKED